MTPCVCWFLNIIADRTAAMQPPRCSTSLATPVCLARFQRGPRADESAERPSLERGGCAEAACSLRCGGHDGLLTISLLLRMRLVRRHNLRLDMRRRPLIVAVVHRVRPLPAGHALE